MIRGGDTFVLVDAGISGKQIRERLSAIGLEPFRLSAILLTHSHSDHVKGLAAVLKTTDACLFTNEATAADACAGLPAERVKFFETGDGFDLGELQVHTFPVSHDTADPVGFTFLRGGKQISIVTDTGIVTRPIYEQIRGADILVLESNHDENILRMGRYPWFLKQRILGEEGHLSNEAAAKALAAALEEERDAQAERQRTVLLAHLSLLTDEGSFMAWAHLMKGLRVFETNNAARNFVKSTFQHAMLPSDFLRNDGLTYVQDFARHCANGDVVVFDTETTGLDVLEDDILSVIKAFKEADEEDDLQFNYISGLHAPESYIPTNIILSHVTKAKDFVQPILHILHPCSIVIRGPNK